jgi:hypothetical protein
MTGGGPSSAAHAYGWGGGRPRREQTDLARSLTIPGCTSVLDSQSRPSLGPTEIQGSEPPGWGRESPELPGLYCSACYAYRLGDVHAQHGQHHREACPSA